jgi:phospholipase/carboxylesterase
MRPLDGPRIPSASGRTGSLVVLLHGYGADGGDLITLAHAWARQLPETAFAAPHAPEPLPAAPIGGRQWFSLTFRDPDELWRGATAAGPTLDRFLDAELARHGLAPDRLALVGFSQGAMMALHSGLRRSPPPAAIVGFSGVIAGPEHLSPVTGARPPVMLVHGAADEVIPVEAIEITREALARAGFAVEWHIARELGHGIDAAGLALAGSFLAEMLGRPSGV